MKKIILPLLLSAVGPSAFAQGTVSFVNTTGTLITTNGMAFGYGSGAVKGTNSAAYYFGLFTAPFGTTNTDLTSGGWTFTGNYATNTLATGGGRLNGGNPLTTLAGWPPGQTNAFIVAGWSASLGHNWSDISYQLAGAQLNGGEWVGNWLYPGFYGQSSIGFGMAGGGVYALPPFPLFGSPNGSGTPLTNGFTLWVVVNGPVQGQAPFISTQPSSTLGYWGKSASFSVTAVGTAPLSYQWNHEGSPLASGTSSSLTLTNLQLSDAGNYNVVVTNAYGSITSSNALLSVNPAGVTLGLYAGLSIDGVVGKTYTIQYSSNFFSWTTLTNLTLTQTPEVWVDISRDSGGHPTGAYRVLPGP